MRSSCGSRSPGSPTGAARHSCSWCGRGSRARRSELLVDAETYLPRELRLVDRLPDALTRRLRWRYVVYERLPLNDKTETLLHFHPPARAKCGPGTDKLDRKGSLGFPNPCAR